MYRRQFRQVRVMSEFSSSILDHGTKCPIRPDWAKLLIWGSTLFTYLITTVFNLVAFGVYNGDGYGFTVESPIISGLIDIYLAIN